ncbi:DUF6476 family protein [Roseicyclus persicicus]|uniref:Uncharacterized protein n=1 Tax=Roseicyclus persicicus TaxID=2650661 RepID=A0A7X6JVK4_9RHOB|nr:DUF6476 family protein [Roseibacterium persicicum]NKX43437.1 hypothetical protein [Roseibacterium persicicum]
MTTTPDGDDGAALPANLRFLKGLVTVLTAVMILGVLTIVALLVIRLNADPVPVLVSPGDFALPAGVGAVGISVIDGRTVIVGDDGRVRVYDSESRALLQDIEIGG